MYLGLPHQCVLTQNNFKIFTIAHCNSANAIGALSDRLLEIISGVAGGGGIGGTCPRRQDLIMLLIFLNCRLFSDALVGEINIK